MTQVISEVVHEMTYHSCTKGGLHCGKPLDAVCLDALCVNDPLSCSVCFSQIHKYHRVIGLNEFIDSYARAVSSFDHKGLFHKINNHGSLVRKSMEVFKQQLENTLSQFEQEVEDYLSYINNLVDSRSVLETKYKVNLDEQNLRKCSLSELKTGTQFILEQSLWKNMPNLPKVSEILRNNELKVEALLDKLINETQKAQENVFNAIKSFGFLNDCLRNEGRLQNYMYEEFLSHRWPKVKPMEEFTTESLPTREVTPLFNYAHRQLEVSENLRQVKSRISASLSPQWAIAGPILNSEPFAQKEWSLKIKSCRNLTSENTLAVGVAMFKEAKNKEFEGKEFKESIVVSSEGYVKTLTSFYQSNLRFTAGDVLHFKYDPFYKTLEIKRQRGPKITLSTDYADKGDLYAAVRLTYASDEVELV